MADDQNRNFMSTFNFIEEELMKGFSKDEAMLWRNHFTKLLGPTPRAEKNAVDLWIAALFNDPASPLVAFHEEPAVSEVAALFARRASGENISDMEWRAAGNVAFFGHTPADHSYHAVEAAGAAASGSQYELHPVAARRHLARMVDHVKKAITVSMLISLADTLG